MSELLHYLHAHKSKSGNSNFKSTTFSQAAIYMNSKFLLAKGTLKTGKICSSRWSKICHIKICLRSPTDVQQIKSAYYIVLDLKNTSGLHYYDSDGVPVTPALKAMWSVYCRQHPEAH
ncbi:hypothetical protein J3R82DRAFT_1863 [Butyriboletus roseoflavus]|nr:hypothetical protein J3R82DRAFT_1863 [Butyriboletus roseoflavus]